MQEIKKETIKFVQKIDDSFVQSQIEDEIGIKDTIEEPFTAVTSNRTLLAGHSVCGKNSL